jgi:hypothetical protein
MRRKEPAQSVPAPGRASWPVVIAAACQPCLFAPLLSAVMLKWVHWPGQDHRDTAPIAAAVPAAADGRQHHDRDLLALDFRLDARILTRPSPHSPPMQRPSLPLHRHHTDPETYFLRQTRMLHIPAGCRFLHHGIPANRFPGQDPRIPGTRSPRKTVPEVPGHPVAPEGALPGTPISQGKIPWIPLLQTGQGESCCPVPDPGKARKPQLLPRSGHPVRDFRVPPRLRWRNRIAH